MTALLWKDWRQSRPLAIAAAVMYLLPAMMTVAAGMIWGYSVGESGRPHAATVRDLAEGVAILALSGAFAATIVVPMYAAVAFARERRERTAEFIGTIPVLRSSVIRSKLFMAATLSAAPLILSLLLAWIAGVVSEESYIKDPRCSDPWWLLFTGSVMLFGWGWLLSSVMRSEVMAAAFGLLGGMLTVGAVLATLSRRGLLEHAGAGPYIITMAIVGVLTLAAGTVVAAVRKSP